MEPPTNAEVLATWLIFAQRSGENGRLMPTKKEIEAILADPPDRWDEAVSLSEALVKKIEKAAPKSLVSTTMDFVSEVNRFNQTHLGGIMSTPKLERTK